MARGLRSAGLLDRYDCTQPMGPGTSLARTKVTRCLVGTPGITYKYLGLRMFAAPWKGEEASSYAKKIRKASKKLEKRASAAQAYELSEQMHAWTQTPGGWSQRAWFQRSR